VLVGFIDDRLVYLLSVDPDSSALLLITSGIRMSHLRTFFDPPTDFEVTILWVVGSTTLSTQWIDGLAVAESASSPP